MNLETARSAKIVMFAGMVLMLVGMSLTLTLSQQQQNLASKAAGITLTPTPACSCHTEETIYCPGVWYHPACDSRLTCQGMGGGRTPCISTYPASTPTRMPTSKPTITPTKAPAPTKIMTATPVCDCTTNQENRRYCPGVWFHPSCNPNYTCQGIGGLVSCAPTATPAPIRTLTSTPAPTCKVVFNTADQLFCHTSAQTIVIQGTIINVPANSTLQKSWQVLAPADKITNTVYTSEAAYPGKTFSISVQWPGIRSTDQNVQVHAGTNMLNSSGNPLTNCTASISYYWSAGRCSTLVP